MSSQKVPYRCVADLADLLETVGANVRGLVILVAVVGRRVSHRAVDAAVWVAAATRAARVVLIRLGDAARVLDEGGTRRVVKLLHENKTSHRTRVGVGGSGWGWG